MIEDKKYTLQQCPDCRVDLVEFIRRDAPEWHDLLCPICGVVYDGYAYFVSDEVMRVNSPVPVQYRDMYGVCSSCGVPYQYVQRGGRSPKYCNRCMKKVRRIWWKMSKRRSRMKKYKAEMDLKVQQNYVNEGTVPVKASR